MQSQLASSRYRGWRESKRLVDLAQSAPADLKKISQSTYGLQSYYDASVAPLLDTLTETEVSEISHLQAQIRFRLSVS